jgi:hypothetical protein
MAKFHGAVGYNLGSAETRPGIWEEVIVERTYYGDVIRNTRQLEDVGQVNKDIRVSNSISIVADAYANDHFFAIRYVEWAGALWDVSDVEVQSPRLLLRLGGVYNGQRPAPTP